MFELYQVGLAFVAVFLGVIAWAGASWLKKSKAQDLELATPEYIEFSNVGTNGFYVATTFADLPLNRVSAHGLGFAGKAFLDVSDRGVRVHRIGERSFRIDSSALIDLRRTSGVIDKVVEKDGLLSLRWKLGVTELETHLRFANSMSRDEIAHDVSKLIVGVK
jgi:hypothetical protein